MKLQHSSAILVLGLSLIGCQAQTQGSSDPTTPAPSTAQPANSPAIAPVAGAPESDPTLGSIPSAPLSENGPWWVFSSDEGIWAVNPDGSGLTHLLERSVSESKSRVFRFEPSPAGGQIALIEIEDQWALTAPTLSLLSLPEGELFPITRLHPETYDPDGYPDDFDRWAATGKWNAISWSPDGKRLAFNAVIDGESGDLYTYGVEDGLLNRLTDGPTEAVFPTWSPDGQDIIHGSVKRLNVDASGAGYDYTGVWSAPADGGIVELLFSSDVIGFENVLGWIDDTTALIDTAAPNENPFCRYRELRAVEIHSGESRAVLSGQYTDRAFDPVSQTVLFSRVEDPICEQELSPGIYILDVEAGAPIRIVENDSFEVGWSPEASLFFAETGTGSVIAVSPSGEFIDLFVPEGAFRSPPIASPASDNLAWIGGEGLWIGSLQDSLDSEPIKVLSERVYQASWSPDGNYLLMLSFDKLFVASSPSFSPIEIMEIRGSSPTWVEGP